MTSPTGYVRRFNSSCTYICEFLKLSRTHSNDCRFPSSCVARNGRSSIYVTCVDILFLMFTQNAQNSFEQVQDYWVQELQHQCFGSGGLQVLSYAASYCFICALLRSWEAGLTVFVNRAGLFSLRVLYLSFCFMYFPPQIAIVGNKCDLTEKRVSSNTLAL